METNNNGGPAFPTQNGCRNDQGMTLRDWFAGMAITPLVQRDTKIAIHELSKYDGERCAPIFYSDPDAYQELACEAYHIADAMIAASERKEEP